MRFAVLACFVALAFAGVNAMPQPESSEVGLAQGRIADRWLINAIAELITWMQRAGLDPLIVDDWFLDYFLWGGLIQIQGTSSDVRGYGLSHIVINRVDYNPVFGLLTYDISLPRVFLSVGDYRVWASVDGNENNFELSGSAYIEDLNIRGTAVLYLNIGVTRVLDVNANLYVKDIESELTVISNRGDVSEQVNYVISEGIERFLIDNKDDVSTFLNLGIKAIAERWWGI